MRISEWSAWEKSSLLGTSVGFAIVVLLLTLVLSPMEIACWAGVLTAASFWLPHLWRQLRGKPDFHFQELFLAELGGAIVVGYLASLLATANVCVATSPSAKKLSPLELDDADDVAGDVADLDGRDLGRVLHPPALRAATGFGARYGISKVGTQRSPEF